jgi:hypothetical protein
MSKIISLKAAREIKDAENEDMAYRAMILSMDKLELLEEMVRFQEERSRLGTLTPAMMIRGKHLFKALEDSAETQELRILTRSYRRHLEFELRSYTESQGLSARAAAAGGEDLALEGSGEGGDS